MINLVYGAPGTGKTHYVFSELQKNYENSVLIVPEQHTVSCERLSLELLPPETVLGRITGDGVGEALLAPLWSRRKTEVANEIDKELYRRGTSQGYRMK